MPKIKTSLARSGQNLRNTTLREIAKTCISPVAHGAINTSRQQSRRASIVKEREGTPRSDQPHEEVLSESIFMGGGKLDEEEMKNKLEKEEQDRQN